MKKLLETIESFLKNNKYVYLVHTQELSYDAVISQLSPLPYPVVEPSIIFDALSLKPKTYLTTDLSKKPGTTNNLVIVTDRLKTPYIRIDKYISEDFSVQVTTEELITPYAIKKKESTTKFNPLIRSMQKIYNKHGMPFAEYYMAIMSVYNSL